jgi:ATP sulfurylase
MTPTHPPPHLAALVDEQTQYCKDCTHIKEVVTVTRTCKLNCVRRTEIDGCLWDGKKYPSRFVRKE